MTLAERGLQIWQVLVGVAHRRETVTYATLTKLIGMNAPGGMGRPLETVYRYCGRERLPPLTILVVSEKTGRPALGSTFELAEQDAKREKVYKYSWFARLPPTVADLDEI
jgi:hypothetical protein